MKRMLFIISCAAFGIDSIMGDVDPFITYNGYPTIEIYIPNTANAEYSGFWHTYYHTYEGAVFNLTYRIYGDSIVNGKKYGRMVFYYETKEDLLTGVGMYQWGRPYGKTEYADSLLYRQDGEKVFCIPKGETEEVLILDYGLEVGDEFVNASGERFRVTLSCPLQDRYDGVWRNVGCCKVKCDYHNAVPKMLELLSMSTGEKDIWIEGLGSVNWGVVPTFIAERIAPFRQLCQHPQRAQVCISVHAGLPVMPNVNENDYKAMFIADRKRPDDDYYIEYSFKDDTLCVNGVQDIASNIFSAYAECLITDNRIDFMLKQATPTPLVKSKFVVQIPGFKAGTYQVGMHGQEGVTLECMGKNTVSVKETSLLPSSQNRLYDLQGRRLMKAPEKGLYIQDGKVVGK